MFCDLGLRLGDGAARRGSSATPTAQSSLLLESSELGYGKVAYVQEVTAREFLAKGFDGSRFNAPKGSARANLLKRLNVAVESVDEVRAMDFRRVLSTYNVDVVAVAPKNFPVLQHLCESKAVGVDLIVLDFNVRLQHAMPKCWKRGVGQDLFFEVSYARAVFDVSARRNFFANISQYANATGGKNLILSSSASDPAQLRAPLDVANLLVLAGIPDEYARACMSNNAVRLLQKMNAAKGGGKSIAWKESLGLSF